jgi:hypothetical protein
MQMLGVDEQGRAPQQTAHRENAQMMIAYVPEQVKTPG